MPRFLAVLTMLICPQFHWPGRTFRILPQFAEKYRGWTAVDTLSGICRGRPVPDDRRRGGSLPGVRICPGGNAGIWRQGRHSVTIELYEMKDPGRHTDVFFQSGARRQRDRHGQWRPSDRLLLELLERPFSGDPDGSDTSSVTKAALTVLGGAVAKKITATGQAPGLSGALRLVIDGHRPW